MASEAVFFDYRISRLSEMIELEKRELEKRELEKIVLVYKELLEKLTAPNASLSEQEALKILLARDAISNALYNNVENCNLAVIEIKKLDKKLKDNADKLIDFIILDEYRNNFPSLPKTWWWYLDIDVEKKRIESHPWNRFDGLIRIIRVMVWTVNLTLLGSLGSLFLVSGSGLKGVLAITFPGILSLLQAQSELTENGKKGFDKLLEKIKLPQHYQEEAKLGSTLLITGLLLTIWLNLPSISNSYKLRGKKSEEQENLALAEESYLQAINLYPDNVDARYKLAKIYEQLQDFDSAKKQHILAAQAGFIDAYNDLAYLYIQEGKNGEAIDLLRKALGLLEKKENQFEELMDSEKLNLKTQTYNIYKNLGWARFEQNQYDDSVSYLLPAMAIAQNTKYKQYIRSPGAAFCIYAKILSSTDEKSSGTQKTWQQCRELLESRLAAGESINPEEDTWLYEAKQQLNN